jgi:HKD family nuclease
MLIVQNEQRPGEIRNALLDLMRVGVRRVRICSAYMSLAGSNLLFDAMCRFVTDGNHRLVEKVIVASLDFGITEPDALAFWKAIRNCEVLVAGTSGLAAGNLSPQSAFHTKYYLFDRPDGVMGSLIGSANLTARGLTINSEIAWKEPQHTEADEVDEAWQEAISPAVRLTDEILNSYRAVRDRSAAAHPSVELEPLPTPRVGPPRRYNAFAEAHVDPVQYSQMWIQSRGLQGGARTQLELPRGSHRFFGATFHGYDYERVDHIVEPILVAGRRIWRDRPLTWHGDNAMERINLPSLAMGGFEYEGSLILFRRIAANTFELRVYPWDSDPARSYVEASRMSGLLFRVGRNSNRFAGLVA